MKPFAHVLHRDTIERLAGSRVFARGEAYFQEGRVRELLVREGELRGRIAGGGDYAARLWVRADSLGYSCDCAYAEQPDGNFCKHLVALALAWLEQCGLSRPRTVAAPGVAPAKAAKVATAATAGELESLQRRLSTLDREQLFRVLVEAARVDPAALAAIRAQLGDAKR